jgi:sulfite exporter TauE/SafE
MLSLALSCFIAALAIGVMVEAVARLFRLWTYSSPIYSFLNIFVAFGLIQGFGVGWIIGGREALRGVFPVLFMVGAVLGLLIEGLNEYWLHAWTWSDRPLLGIRRPIDKAAFVGVIWGFAPLSTVFLARLIAASPAGAAA